MNTEPVPYKCLRCLDEGTTVEEDFREPGVGTLLKYVRCTACNPPELDLEPQDPC